MRFRSHSRTTTASLVLLVTLGASCAVPTGVESGNSLVDGGASTQQTTCSAAPYSQKGPHEVGVTTLTIDGLPVEVWYPADAKTATLPRAQYDMRAWLPKKMADGIPTEAPTRFTQDAARDAKASQYGPFPLVLFSHGLGGFRTQSSAIMARLASWGMVVAAPEHAERGLAAILGGDPPKDFAVTQLRTARAGLEVANKSANSPIFGKVDLSRVAALGHSMGGAAVAMVAGDDGIAGFAVMASGGFTGAPAKPALLIGGSNDNIATAKLVEKSFASLEGDKRYVQISKAGHLAFSDICAIGRAEGGVLAIAKKNGVGVPEIVETLATDGCNPGDLTPEAALPVIGHLLVAHFRHALAIDPLPQGLAANVGDCFPGLIAKFQQSSADQTTAPNNRADAAGSTGGGSPPGTKADAGRASTPADAGGTPGSSEDAGMTPDTGSSAAADAGSTAPEPTPVDAGASPPMDAGSESPSPDAGSTTTPPVTPDAGTKKTDAGTSQPTAGGAGVVKCGMATCDLSSEVCCTGLSGQKCAAKCGFLEAPAKCDGPEDCASGQVCCAGFPQGASCKASCGPNEQQMCKVNAHCSGGKTCQACSFPGSPPTLVCTTGC